MPCTLACSHTTLADIRAIPRRLLHYAQIRDAEAGTHFSTEQLLHTARCASGAAGRRQHRPARPVCRAAADLPVSVEVVNLPARGDHAAEALGRVLPGGEPARAGDPASLKDSQAASALAVAAGGRASGVTAGRPRAAALCRRTSATRSTSCWDRASRLCAAAAICSTSAAFCWVAWSMWVTASATLVRPRQSARRWPSCIRQSGRSPAGCWRPPRSWCCLPAQASREPWATRSTLR